MNEGGRIPERKEGFRIAILDDEVLLYCQGKAQASHLNSTAAIIWGLCDGEKTLAEIGELIAGSYPEARESIQEQVSSTIELFVDMGGIAYK